MCFALNVEIYAHTSRAVKLHELNFNSVISIVFSVQNVPLPVFFVWNELAVSINFVMLLN